MFTNFGERITEMFLGEIFLEPIQEEMTELDLTNFLLELPEGEIRGPKIRTDGEERDTHPNELANDVMNDLWILHNQYKYQLTTLTTHQIESSPEQEHHSLFISLYDHMGQLGKTLILGDCIHTIDFSYYLPRKAKRGLLGRFIFS